MDFSRLFIELGKYLSNSYWKLPFTAWRYSARSHDCICSWAKAGKLELYCLQDTKQEHSLILGDPFNKYMSISSQSADLPESSSISSIDSNLSIISSPFTAKCL